MKRTQVSSGTEWESTVGYSRAVRIGSHVHVSGTTATDEAGDVIASGDPYRQTKVALRNVERALGEIGASLENVIRTRMFVTDIERWEAIGEAHKEAFGAIRPATSMVEVNRLVDPNLLVEIEAVAIVPE